MNGKRPLAETIKATRERIHLTQKDAAALVYVDLRTWQKWEAGERAMMSSVWELFLLKTGEAHLVNSE